ncbi:hypothetical protein M0804_009327 [Polistes exclamans]|nr:hypothetical protein M0804_009327 [Polistes exclamans]
MTSPVHLLHDHSLVSPPTTNPVAHPFLPPPPPSSTPPTPTTKTRTQAENTARSSRHSLIIFTTGKMELN